MKIVIENPKLITIGNGLTLKSDMNKEQVIRIIEKLLLTKSIICENIK